MFHQNYLKCFTFCTQVKYGPHPVIHEHTPNFMIHWELSNSLISFPNVEHHVLDDMVLHVFSFVAECLKFFCWISSTGWGWCQSYSGSPRCCRRRFPRLRACGASNKNFTNSGLDFFPAVTRHMAPGFSMLFHLCDLFRNLPLSLFMTKNVVAPCFPRLYYWGSRRCDHPLSTLLIFSFLVIRQRPRNGFGFSETCCFAETYSPGISPVRFDMFLSRKDANTTEALQECAS